MPALSDAAGEQIARIKVHRRSADLLAYERDEVVIYAPGAQAFGAAC